MRSSQAHHRIARAISARFTTGQRNGRMRTARPVSPVSSALRRIRWQEIRDEAAGLLRATLFHIVGGTVLLTLLTAAYIVKRALGLDLVPGLDMLPDAEIE